MTQHKHHPDERELRRRGFRLLGVAGGAAVGVLLVALGTPGVELSDEGVWIDSAPASTHEPVAHPRLAALDSGVDWSRVESASDFGPAAVAAYER